MGGNWPMFLSGGEWVPQHGESLPAVAVSHSSGDPDQEARRAVEGGTKSGETCPDPEVVVCARWAEIMEAA